uniref:S1 motif domain-containing protein n=1 Tax=Syphacia muris TaxID=451379 RepID=A0A0N5AFB0_9BILA
MSTPKERKGEVSSTGRVTRVDVKYAFISSNKLGSVFVPPSAALPPDCPISDLTHYFKAGDIVHFVAVRQHGKNECQWLATKVSLSSNNEMYQNPEKPSTSKQQIVWVSSVSETFAYGRNEELGMVFIPGVAFSPTEVTKLDSYLSSGDTLIVTVRPQSERSGCSWIAEFATKVMHQAVNLPANSCSNSTELSNDSVKDRPEIRRGLGVVTEVTKTTAVVYDSFGEMMKCSCLTWKGGCRGNILADGLDEIVFPGEYILFEAVLTSSGWRTLFWNCMDDESNQSDASTQTAITPEQMILRAFDEDIISYLRKKIPNVLAYNHL